MIKIFKKKNIIIDIKLFNEEVNNVLKYVNKQKKEMLNLTEKEQIIIAKDIINKIKRLRNKSLQLENKVKNDKNLSEIDKNDNLDRIINILNSFKNIYLMVLKYEEELKKIENLKNDIKRDRNK